VKLFFRKRRIFKISVVYIIYLTLKKYKIVICMKVTGETFSLIKKEKKPKRKVVISIKTFRQKDYYRTGL
jgi:hypothetical protein